MKTNKWKQTLYQEAIKFATAKHLEKEQKVPGTDLPYVVHLSNVAMEIIITSSKTINFNLGFAVQIALLHDTIEDTSTNFEELVNKFGIEIANTVFALTKNSELPKELVKNKWLYPNDEFVEKWKKPKHYKSITFEF